MAVAFDRLMVHIAAGLDGALRWLIETGVPLKDIRIEQEQFQYGKAIAVRKKKTWHQVFECRVTLPDLEISDPKITVEHVWLDPAYAPTKGIREAITDDGKVS